jgi:hypothetical protein
MRREKEQPAIPSMECKITTGCWQTKVFIKNDTKLTLIFTQSKGIDP